jgi:hypothetical protein
MQHTCYRCGGSCQGPGASVDADERTPLLAHARVLGIDDPLVGARTRTVGGRCVFLDQDNRCSLHVAFGPDAKPRSCQAFPFVHLPDGRVGIDPGCLTGFLSTRGQPVTDPPPPRSELPLHTSVEHALARLIGRSTPVTARPPRPIRLWAARQLPDVLDAVLATSSAPGLRARLRHLTRLKARDAFWDTPWDLPEDSAFHALGVAQRMVALELSPRPPERIALDTLRGAALCAWADGSLHRFAPALAAWTRLQRSGPLLEVLDRPLPEDG